MLLLINIIVYSQWVVLKFQNHAVFKVHVFVSAKPGLLITILHFKPLFTVFLYYFFVGVLNEKYYSVNLKIKMYVIEPK